MADPTFAEAWCAKHGTTPEAFATTVLPRALHAHARLVAPVIRFFDHNHFAADLDLVRAAGELRRVRDLADEITDFNHHPANTGFWRQTMIVRISTHRLRHLMRTTLPHHTAHGGSRPPLSASAADQSPQKKPLHQRRIASTDVGSALVAGPWALSTAHPAVAPYFSQCMDVGAQTCCALAFLDRRTVGAASLRPYIFAPGAALPSPGTQQRRNNLSDFHPGGDMMVNMSDDAPNDLELLDRYARAGDEAAFAALARRHLNLVHSAALRQVRSPQLAEEVAQSVFADLARSARRLPCDTVLPAWLWSVARHTAVDVVRREARRRQREQTAHELAAMNTPDADWSQVAPLLDEALQSLDETDRAVVVLRWFENKPLREVGAALGLGEDAAQKRASRALDRLREFFTRRGVTVGAGGLAAALSANAVQASPIGLAGVVTVNALVAGAATATGWHDVWNAILSNMTTTKLACIVALCVSGIAIPVRRHFWSSGGSARPAVNVAPELAADAEHATELAVQPPAVPATTSSDPDTDPASNAPVRIPIPSPAAPSSPIPPPDSRRIDVFSLRDAPLDMVLDQLKEWTGRKVIHQENLAMRYITINITRPVTVEEAVRAVISILQLNGIGVTFEGDDVLRVANLAKTMP